MSLRCVRLDPDCGDVVDTLHMVDISRGGMGAICERPFYPGQRIVLCLPQTGENGRRNIYASVVRSRLTDEEYRVGLAFDRSSASTWYAAPAAVALAA
jgi:c-di-GMP-binding flagellar brake protein YcgR